MKIFIIFLFFIIPLIAETSYKFGVFPHMPLAKLHKVFGTVTNDLERDLNKSITLMTRPYYKQYKTELNRGLYDFAFIQPLDYVEAHRLQGYIPLARRNKDLKAILVVLKASSYEKVSDVQDKVIASAPAQAAVSQMMLVSLEKDGFHALDDFTISYSKNHFVCLQKLVDAKVAACITARRAMEFFNQEKNTTNFKIIYETKTLPHALFVAHPRVPKDIRDKVQRRILRWTKYKKGRSLLKKGKLLDFIEAKDKDYDRVREFMKRKDDK
ncbi:MAG: hypothetical protein COA44_00850 [Arcobacter sp.]|nr:MAG: hypothetical protein COA44_00850 [Arcobacter sp.]